ncbi:MAG: hypothetical protein MI919_19350, partial [Holophagales bacterium]|nr:hypothetical protein [Holophagales bacterium]
AEAFEDHYMSCETCVARLERAELMVGGMKRMAAEDLGGAAPDAGSGMPRDAGPGGGGTLAFPSRGARSALRQVGWLAAGLLAGTVLLPVWRGDSTGEGPAAVSVFHLQPERSLEAEPGHRIQLPPESAVLVLALELTPPVYDTYRMSLMQAAGTVWTASGLTLGERDTVHVQLPSGVLEEGVYVLALEGAASDAGPWAEASRFSFRVEGPPPG